MPMQRSHGVYAHRGIWGNGHKCRTVLLHREILDASPSQVVDHINGDTLDNRRSNLRITDRYGNARNRRVPAGKSGFTGVRQKGARWVGIIRVLGRTHYTKSFRCPILAAAARDVLARQFHGEFAVLNFHFTPVASAPTSVEVVGSSPTRPTTEKPSIDTWREQEPLEIEATQKVGAR